MIQFTDGTYINHCFCYMDKNKKCTHTTLDKSKLVPIKIKTVKKDKKNELR